MVINFFKIWKIKRVWTSECDYHNVIKNLKELRNENSCYTKPHITNICNSIIAKKVNFITGKMTVW